MTTTTVFDEGINGFLALPISVDKIAYSVALLPKLSDTGLGYKYALLWKPIGRSLQRINCVGTAQYQDVGAAAGDRITLGGEEACLNRNVPSKLSLR